MIRSYPFQNPRAFPMVCATFETTAQKTLGTLACRDIWGPFHQTYQLQIWSSLPSRYLEVTLETG